MLGTLKFAAFAFVICLIVANFLSNGAHLDPRFSGAPHRSAQTQTAPASAAPMRAVLPVRTDEVRIPANRMGQFSADVEVNGARLRGMMVDTGATLVALSYEDAAAAGLFPAPSDYRYQVNTANGVAHVAQVRLNDIRIGNIVVHDVAAFVGERGALSGSLLGMTFLSRLSRFSVESGALILKQ